jgi:cystathionine beta-lyase/cystathionine gamma-synthase
MHPSLPTHPSYELAKKFFKCNKEGIKLYPSVLSFKLNIDKNQCLNIIHRNTKIKCETSFGSSYSKIDNNFTYDEETSSTTCRLYIGFADQSDEILQGLNEIFIFDEVK